MRAQSTHTDDSKRTKSLRSTSRSPAHAYCPPQRFRAHPCAVGRARAYSPLATATTEATASGLASHLSATTLPAANAAALLDVVVVNAIAPYPFIVPYVANISAALIYGDDAHGVSLLPPLTSRDPGSAKLGFRIAVGTASL